MMLKESTSAAALSEAEAARDATQRAFDSRDPRDAGKTGDLAMALGLLTAACGALRNAAGVPFDEAS